MLPSKYIIDYVALLSSKTEDRGTLAILLSERLPTVWCETYLRTITHEPNFVHFRQHTFKYVCDLYSQLEMMGSVPYDQTVADRVVGVFGISSRLEQNRNTRRVRIELSEELEGSRRDDGHFMARSIGGGLDVNLFSQDRLLNRGWSSQGNSIVGWKNTAASRKARSASRVRSTPTDRTFRAG